MVIENILVVTNKKTGAVRSYATAKCFIRSEKLPMTEMAFSTLKKRSYAAAKERGDADLSIDIPFTELSISFTKIHRCKDSGEFL